MAFVNDQTKRKLETIASHVERYAHVIGKPDGDIGLGLSMEAGNFLLMSKNMRAGVFNLLIMGKFKNGKSTFINAIVGREMMPTKASACTAVIAIIEHGKDTDKIKIVYTEESHRQARKVKREDFFKEFALTIEDERNLAGGGDLDRFAEVDHVEVQSSDDLFANGEHLIDSPGLEDRISCTKATNNYVPKAHAIIFTLSATSIFSANEKAYVQQNFAGKHMKNVFFVINRIDQLQPGQLEASIKPTVRNTLQSVFTDESGAFDEVLYNRRVFYTNAYGAYCIRAGKPYTIMIGNKEIPIPIKLEDTGIIEFEDALRQFLNSDERLNATFSSTFVSMTNSYRKAMAQVFADKRVRSLSADERKSNAEAAEQEFLAAKQNVDNINKAVGNTAMIVSQKLYLDLLRFIQQDIPQSFATYVNDGIVQNKFGIGGMLQLAVAAAGTNTPINSINNFFKNHGFDPNEILKPFVDHINKYIKDQLEMWATVNAVTLVEADLAALETEVDAQIKDFDLHLEEAINLFVTGNAATPVEQGGGLKAGLQGIMAIVWNIDVNLAAGAAVAGGLSWREFILRAIGQTVLDVGIIVVLGAPLLIPILVGRLLTMRFTARHMGSTLLNNMGERTFNEVAKNIRDYELNFKEQLENEFYAKGHEISKAALALLKDAEDNQKRLLSENAADQAAADAENARADRCLVEMKSLIGNVYAELYGKQLSTEDFSRLTQ